MANATITIPLDPQTAKAYKRASAKEKRRMQALVSLWLRGLTTNGSASIEEVLEETGRKAKERGLTAEVLESLLKGA